MAGGNGGLQGVRAEGHRQGFGSRQRIESPPDEQAIPARATYEFGSHLAKHHFCRKCGIYPFHQTMRKPGHYRINAGCIEELDFYRL